MLRPSTCLALSLAALLALLSATAEAGWRDPREGPLPLTELYVKPIKGKSTYYGNYQWGGACGLDQPDGSPIPPEIQGIDFTVAMDQAQYNQGSCGMCIELTGTGKGSGGDPVRGTYHVFVNNLCPECEYGHLDFAEPGDGLWDIEWKAVPCNVGNHTMRWVFMGSNEYYLKVAAQGAKFPTKRLRLKLDGDWVEGVPVHGSYFEFRGHAPYHFPIEVEVTSALDEVLTDVIDSIQGGPSRIQYRDEPINEEEPGEEVEDGSDDDVEEPGTNPPTPQPKEEATHRFEPRPGNAKNKNAGAGAAAAAAQPKYEQLSYREYVEEDQEDAYEGEGMPNSYDREPLPLPPRGQYLRGPPRAIRDREYY